MSILATLYSPLLPPERGARRAALTVGALLILAIAALVVFFSPWQQFAAVLTVVALAMAIYRPSWLLFFLALWIPLEPFVLKFAPDEIYLFARYFSEGLIYALAAVAAIRAAAGSRRLKKTPLDLPFILFLIVLLASALLNFAPAHVALLGIRQITRFIILFFVVFYLYPTREFIRKLLLAMFALAAFESLLGIAQAIFGAPLDEFLIPSERRFFESIQLTTGTVQFWDPGSRIFATLGRYDQLGTFLTFFLLILVGLFYSKGLENKKRALFLTLALGLPALLLTFSRASWFGFLLGLAVIGIWIVRDRRVTLGFALFAALLSSYLIFSGIVVPRLVEEFGRQTPAERFFEAFSYERWRGEYIGLGRLYWIVKTPAVVVRGAPLFGVGPGQYGGGAAAALGNQRAYNKMGLPFGVYGSEGYIDNNWFSLWGETGTLGFLLYWWMFIALGAAALKVWRNSTDPLARGLALGFVGALAAVILQAALGTYLEMRTLALYLWMFGAFVVVLGRRERII